MVNEILVCLDGSSFAEAILPYARGIARSLKAKLALLRIIDREEEFSAARKYLLGFARRYDADARVRMKETDAASSIVAELRQKPFVLAAMTTHGHTGMLEALVGSVAFSVVRGAGRPLLLYRPPAHALNADPDAEIKIASVVATLDGQEFSEKILPYAVEMAQALKARLELVQALALAGPESRIPPELGRDVLETSYLCRQAQAITEKHGLKVDWDVLHGQPADAIIRYLEGRLDVLLAMTSHARLGLERAIFGSVARECVRRAKVPLLLYWPDQ
ncbi:MAG: universal stress protein [Deltaproteobacteria bacterium]|nr:universal stress protein [Deltaproteobacteria bacterium]